MAQTQTTGDEPTAPSPPPPFGSDSAGGKRVRTWRLAQTPPLNQRAFARHAGVSIGALQAFERGIRATQASTVAKIAAAMGLTVAQLEDQATGDANWRTHPLVRDLRLEDYRIAHQFHHADAEVKYAVKVFFSHGLTDEIRERVARIVHLLSTTHAVLVRQVEDLLAAWASAPQPTVRVPADAKPESRRRGLKRLA